MPKERLSDAAKAHFLLSVVEEHARSRELSCTTKCFSHPGGEWNFRLMAGTHARGVRLTRASSYLILEGSSRSPVQAVVGAMRLPDKCVSGDGFRELLTELLEWHGQLAEE